MDFIKSTCSLTGETFEISGTEQELCRKFQVPLPTTTPLERLRRLSAFHNFTNLYRGVCAGSGEKILQIYRPLSKFPVYAVPYWWSDKWSALDYGQEYSSQRPFFEQLAELQSRVPVPALQMTFTTVENCDFVNGVSFSKNCYLTFNTSQSEDCLYCIRLLRSKDCIDCSACVGCELCYDGIELANCYETRHAFNSQNCRDSAFLWNCQSCMHCFGCVNLRQASYCFFNEQLTPSAYRAKLATLELDDADYVQRLRSDFLDFVSAFPQPAIRGIEFGSSSGDFLRNCENAIDCFDGGNLRDCVNCLRIDESNDCLDVYTFGIDVELAYNTCRVGYGSSNIKCCYFARGSSDIEYSMYIVDSKNCFACVGLRQKEFCIFNKQYSKSDYTRLRAEIIQRLVAEGIYGQFFPNQLSYFPYNDSDANMLFPLAEADVRKLGFRWEESTEESAATGDSSPLPARTRDVDDRALNRSFRCPVSGKAFRLTTKELENYRSRGLPIPREHWRTRLLNRQALMNQSKLYNRHCQHTGVPIRTTWPPTSKFQVWSNEAFASLF